MRKVMIRGLVLGLALLMPAAARAQSTMIQPVDFTGFLSHPGYDQGGWFIGTDFMVLQKVLGTYNGTAPDSVLSLGYRTQEGTVYQFSWMDQWFSDTTAASDRLQILEFSTRIEMYKTDCYRQYVTFGPRAILTSTDVNFPGGLSYDVDNNMVGFFIGAMNEWYLGSNPLGTFSFTLDGDVGAYANFVRQAAGSAGGSNVLNTFTVSGSLQGKAGFIWYIWEGISIHAGLEVLTIINLQQPSSAPVLANNSVSTSLSPTMPIFLGAYFGFGFVF